MDIASLLGMVFAPFVTVGIVFAAYCIKYLIVHKMKNGWLKDQLLRERWNSAASESHRRVTGGQKSFR